MNPALVAIPDAPEPRLPDLTSLASRLAALGWVLFAFFLLDAVCLLLMDFWLLQSLGFESVFWINFGMGAKLFAAGVVSGAAVVLPAFLLKVPAAMRSLVVHAGILYGLVAGYALCGQYVAFLTASGGGFGEVDPVFGKDPGFYIFRLPQLEATWWLLFAASLAGVVSSLACSFAAGGERPAGPTALVRVLGAAGTLPARVAIGAAGCLAAVGWWLARYEILLRDNEASSVFTGPSYVDATGLFSTLNEYHVTAIATLAGTWAVVAALGRCRAAMPDGAAAPVLRPLACILLGATAVDFGFKALVGVRQTLFVVPNEPVIQMPYIQKHIEATRNGFNLGNIEAVRLVPNGPGDPLPDLDRMLASPTLRNAALWPGFCAYLEDLIDGQHADRILQTGGDPMIYGPVLEIFRQQQKLRAYYDFLDIDTLRFTENGRKFMAVTSVREVPLVEPVPWLAWWGQQFMLYTHGYGLVAAHATEKTPAGEPVFLASGIPPTSKIAALATPNPRAYYGEGAGSMAYSNVRNMTELDYPTDEGRAVTTFPKDVAAGVNIDSLLKRLVFGYKSGQFWQIVFSDLIGDETRVHYFRSPLERIDRVAPFLFLDSDPFAVPTRDGLVWMVNGMTWADRYPCSRFQELGDKSDSRSPFPARPHRNVNYVRDAVKATVDAHSGKVTLYRFADEPVLDVFAGVYPGLFTPASEMPAEQRAQIQYPAQLMHVQFDDCYILYQMNDPMTFFNMEDMWDDGDEVLGPMLDSGEAIRFSIEPFFVMVDTADPGIPDSEEGVQFAMSMVFTPENALNLRAIPMVYQDGKDYGRTICLQVPKGHYSIGPEQADAAIDQDVDIAQTFTWWNRQGLDCIRGHTLTLLVENEVLYVEPVFLRSQQNRFTQMKKICVVFRGTPAMGDTLEGALRAAVDAHVRGLASAGLRVR
jgi:uncharacterized membrane protein (UPF0182 family)